MMRLLPVVSLIVAFSALIMTVSSVASLRMKTNAAASVTCVVFALLLPFAGNYYPVDSLSENGGVGVGYFLSALGAIVPAIGASLVLGVPDEHYRT